jgi:hypothetical protein
MHKLLAVLLSVRSLHRVIEQIVEQMKKQLLLHFRVITTDPAQKVLGKPVVHPEKVVQDLYRSYRQR